MVAYGTLLCWRMNRMYDVLLPHRYAVVIPRWWWVVSHTRGRAGNPCSRQVGTRELALGYLLFRIEYFRPPFKTLLLLPHHSTTPSWSCQSRGHSGNTVMLVVLNVALFAQWEIQSLYCIRPCHCRSLHVIARTIRLTMVMAPHGRWVSPHAGIGSHWKYHC